MLLIALTMTTTLSGALYERQGEMYVKRDLLLTVQLMRADIRYIGYNVSGQVVLLADTSRFRFLADLDDNGTTEQIDYYLGPTSEMSSTANPNDRILYRQVTGGASPGTQVYGRGITSFIVKPYDAAGNDCRSDLTKTKSFEISMTMQRGTMLNGYYPSSYWVRRFFPPNL